MNKPYKSHALWPEEAGLCCENPTTDTHCTEHEARCVCTLLERNGFGGDRQIFPIRTWVTVETEL